MYVWLFNYKISFASNSLFTRLALIKYAILVLQSKLLTCSIFVHILLIRTRSWRRRIGNLILSSRYSFERILALFLTNIIYMYVLILIEKKCILNCFCVIAFHFSAATTYGSGRWERNGL